MQKILIDLGDRGYPVFIGRNTLSTFGEVCKSMEVPQRVAVVTDANVARLYLKTVSNAMRHVGFIVDSIVIPPGEQQKTLQRANAIITKLLHLGVGRQSALVALGGGVVGDLTGFVASTYRRGVTFVQCPTTLLSQVDSSIGGKVGVNHPWAKNAIGTFYQPRFVFSDVALLQTLPQREIVSGIGEILKYGIVGGRETFEYVKSSLSKILAKNFEAIEEVAVRCISIKTNLVEEDERETKPDGGRGVLNVGHAVGQTLEALSNYSLRHGEAVLLGLRVETRIAKELGILAEKDFKELEGYLNSVDFGYSLGRRHSGARRFSQEKLVRILTKVKFALPAGIGNVQFCHSVPEAVLESTLREFLRA